MFQQGKMIDSLVEKLKMLDSVISTNSFSAVDLKSQCASKSVQDAKSDSYSCGSMDLTLLAPLVNAQVEFSQEKGCTVLTRPLDAVKMQPIFDESATIPSSAKSKTGVYV